MPPALRPTVFQELSDPWQVRPWRDIQCDHPESLDTFACRAELVAFSRTLCLATEVCAGWEAAVVALEAHFGSVFKQVGDELVEFRWQVLDADFAQLRDVVEADMAG